MLTRYQKTLLIFKQYSMVLQCFILTHCCILPFLQVTESDSIIDLLVKGPLSLVCHLVVLCITATYEVSLIDLGFHMSHNSSGLMHFFLPISSWLYFSYLWKRRILNGMHVNYGAGDSGPTQPHLEWTMSNFLSLVRKSMRDSTS